MNWYENLNRNVVSYDLILRDPLQFGSYPLLNFKNLFNEVSLVKEVSFSKSKNKEMSSLLVFSVLQELSLNNKIFFQKIKGISGKKNFKFSSKLKGRNVFFFLDFFLHLIVRGLKRRYIVLKVSSSSSGILNFRFSSLPELELDDFFSFPLDEWLGFLNIFLKYSNDKNLNILYCLFFKNIFNLDKLIKYEVFSRKG